ncbi:MAG: TVP38/TMEM64 family protein [Elusimicrobia bacterium]|nr:TVP38/TMEM64 family protein [Elusimicrobiota bacterium]
MKPRYLALALPAAGLFVLLQQYDVRALLEGFLIRVHGLGPWAPAAFMAAYVAACVLFIPGALLTLGAGALFGLVMGTVYVSIASVAGATASFLIGRYLAGEWVARKLETNPRFAAVSAAVAREGWKIVGLTRLSPVFPFNLLNYAFGITEVRLRDYVLASWIGMLPGTVMYVYIGSLAGSLAGLGSGGRARTPMEWALYAVGLAATVAVSVLITRVARSALEQHTRAPL